jgi:hypothetical protein
MAELTLLALDPFSRVLLECLEVSGSSASTRRWLVRKDLPDASIALLGMALRSAKDLGRAVLGILRLEARYKWRTSASPMLVLDTEHELPIAVHIAEEIDKTTPLFVVGARLPPAACLADPRYPQWWGILAATIPIEEYVTTIREFWNEYVSHWAGKPENKSLVISTSAFRAARAKREADEAHVKAAATVVARSHARADPSTNFQTSTASTTRRLRRNDAMKRRRGQDHNDQRPEVAQPAPATVCPAPGRGFQARGFTTGGRAEGRGGRRFTARKVEAQGLLAVPQ